MSSGTPASDTSTPTANGERDDRGRFVPGNRAAVGKQTPDARKAAEWRASFRDAVSADDVMQVVVALVNAAKAGEAWAVRDLLDRTVGPSGKIDLNIGAGGALQVLIVPPDGLQSPKPLGVHGDDLLDADVTHDTDTDCERLGSPDGQDQGETGHGAGHAGLEESAPSDQEGGSRESR